MTEKYWQSKVQNDKSNKPNEILRRTYQDKIDKAPNKHFKDLYYECLKGSLNIRQWEISDELEVEDMAVLACRNVGCELNYCTTSMFDAYERPFNDCDQQQKEFFTCINQEIRMYNLFPKGNSIKEHLQFVLNQKKDKKYKFLFEKINFNKYKYYFDLRNSLGINVKDPFKTSEKELLNQNMVVNY